MTEREMERERWRVREHNHRGMGFGALLSNSGTSPEIQGRL